ncbi:hypothetical protein L484_016682 [Morus notabilis]|uniref:UspA domain-containing protein n=1 Tax=Morus notabilis TaxID=981085 RepID=W9RGB9_9ROSA|nr:uncharacterized protein LOC21399721 [Morus notabilis]EXB89121.1 hypothetical protein L484_016682 [Morus notabilis]
MGRKYGRLCIGRLGGACFRVKPRSSSFGSTGQKAEFLSNNNNNSTSSVNGGISSSEEFSMQKVDDHEEKISGNKIMIVVDSSLEAEGALEWALSHTVQSQDTVVLLHVSKPAKQDSNGKVNNLRVTELLHSMKNNCQRKRPGVKVEIELLQGKERGPIIVEAAKRQKVSLLVLGQKRERSVWWSLIMRMRWSRNGKRRDVAEYCIENASCMTIAVRRKNRKLGGYLITTKRHKNFWLLA